MLEPGPWSRAERNLFRQSGSTGLMCSAHTALRTGVPVVSLTIETQPSLTSLCLVNSSGTGVLGDRSVVCGIDGSDQQLGG
jgi:hypothetical protein